MPTTRGPVARAKRFFWHYAQHTQSLVIQNEDGRLHEYSAQEIAQVLHQLYERFGQDWFPLANNVEKLNKGTERWGLGRVILESGPERADAVLHAQGSSYLGVVLEECGYLEWNGKHRGIEWRLIDLDFSAQAVESRLAERRSAD